MRDVIIGFIPIVGRFFYPNSFPQCKVKIPLHWKVWYFFENVILYALLPLLAVYFFSFDMVTFFLIIAFVFPIVGYIEFRDMQVHPARYSKHDLSPVTKAEFIWVVYHAFWATILGFFLGGVLRTA